MKLFTFFCLLSKNLSIFSLSFLFFFSSRFCRFSSFFRCFRASRSSREGFFLDEDHGCETKQYSHFKLSKNFFAIKPHCNALALSQGLQTMCKMLLQKNFSDRPLLCETISFTTNATQAASRLNCVFMLVKA